METRPYFILGDLISNMLAGAAVGCATAALITVNWPMPVSMLTGMVSEVRRGPGFGDSLPGPAANAGDANESRFVFGLLAAHRLGREFEHRSEQACVGLADLELCCVDTDRDASRPGRHVVAGEGPLPAFVQLSPVVECKRMGRDDAPLAESPKYGCWRHGRVRHAERLACMSHHAARRSA